MTETGCGFCTLWLLPALCLLLFTFYIPVYLISTPAEKEAINQPDFYLFIYWIKYKLFFLQLNCPIVQILITLPKESQLQQSHATQPTVHAGCFSVSMIHRTLT